MRREGRTPARPIKRKLVHRWGQTLKVTPDERGAIEPGYPVSRVIGESSEFGGHLALEEGSDL